MCKSCNSCFVGVNRFLNGRQDAAPTLRYIETIGFPVRWIGADVFCDFLM